MRPSTSSTVSPVSETSMPLALASLSVVIPFLQEVSLVCLYYSEYTPDFNTAKPPVPLDSDRVQPKLRYSILPLHVNVRRFIEVKGHDEDSVWA